jgi:hypothetical protein
VLTSGTEQFGNGFDWSPDGAYLIGTTPQGDPQLLVLATGVLLPLSLGRLASMAWYDDPS